MLYHCTLLHSVIGLSPARPTFLQSDAKLNQLRLGHSCRAGSFTFTFGLVGIFPFVIIGHCDVLHLRHALQIKHGSFEIVGKKERK